MYNLNNKFFESIDCELKAYWLGFLFADGCILESFNKYTGALKAMRLQLSLSEKDIEHVKNFKHDRREEVAEIGIHHLNQEL